MLVSCHIIWQWQWHPVTAVHLDDRSDIGRQGLEDVKRRRPSPGHLPGCQVVIFLQGEPKDGYLFLVFFCCGKFWNYLWVPGSMLSCFSAFLLFVVPASLLYLLLFFSASLLFCFCASVPFYFHSTFSFLQACVFVALLPAPLLLCCLSILPLRFHFFCFILSCL